MGAAIEHSPQADLAANRLGAVTALVTALLTVVACASMLVSSAPQRGNTAYGNVAEVTVPLCLLAGVVLIATVVRRRGRPGAPARACLLLVAAVAWLLPVLGLALQQLTPGEVGSGTCGTPLDPVRVDGPRESAACERAHDRWRTYMALAAIPATGLVLGACVMTARRDTGPL